METIEFTLGILLGINIGLLIVLLLKKANNL